MGMIVAILIAVFLLNIGEKYKESDDLKKAAGGLLSTFAGTVMGGIILVITVIIFIGSL